MKQVIIILAIILLLLIYNISSCVTVGDTINIGKGNKPYLWTYWELINGSTEPPSYISLCIDIMKKNSAKYWNIVVLDEKSIYIYLPDLRSDINNLPIALKADYIRIALLEKYGGLWMDADTIMMTDLKDLRDMLIKGIDFIGFGCTGMKCLGKGGYGKPSNGVMGSQKHGRLISRCLGTLDKILDNYRDSDKGYDFNYFDLGKMIIWREYNNMIAEDPTYTYYHVPSEADGTRDKDGNWIAPNIIFPTDIALYDENKLLVVMLANSVYCSNDKKYNWFCKLSKDQILNGNYFVTKLFNKALKFQSIDVH